MRLIWALSIAAGAALLPVTSMCGEWYVSALKPTLPVIKEVIVNGRDDVGSVLLSVRFHITPAPRCVLLAFHSLSRPPTNAADGEKIFLLLGGTVLGPGFRVLAGQDFTVHFHLPSTIIPATYNYSYRLFYQCGLYELVPFTMEVTAPVIIPPITALNLRSGDARPGG